MRRFAFLIVAGVFLLLPHTLSAQQGATWVVSWAASAHGPYPVGNPSAQPDQRFAFPLRANRGERPDVSPDVPRVLTRRLWPWLLGFWHSHVPRNRLWAQPGHIAALAQQPLSSPIWARPA
jgi:hypothetical protein